MDRDKVLISKFDGYFFAEYPGTALRGCGESIDAAIRDLENMIARLKD